MLFYHFGYDRLRTKPKQKLSIKWTKIIVKPSLCAFDLIFLLHGKLYIWILVENKSVHERTACVAALMENNITATKYQRRRTQNRILFSIQFHWKMSWQSHPNGFEWYHTFFSCHSNAHHKLSVVWEIFRFAFFLLSEILVWHLNFYFTLWFGYLGVWICVWFHICLLEGRQ